MKENNCVELGRIITQIYLKSVGKTTGVKLVLGKITRKCKGEVTSLTWPKGEGQTQN
jgi:hypothetical protein